MIHVDFSLPKSYIHIDPAKRQAYAFRTYMGYWVCLADYIQSQYTDDYTEPLLKTLREQPDYDKIPINRESVNPDAIRSLVLNGWISELRLNMIDLDDQERLVLSNHGAPVDAYYSTFHHAAAWLTARNGPVPQTHGSQLKIIASQISGSRLYPSPWNFLCTSVTPEGTYSGFTPEKCSNLAMAANRKDRAGMLLRTTRGRKLDEICNKERRSGRLPNGARKRFDEKLLPTTTFDFAWRMRKRSDYDDPAMFHSGTPNHEQALIFAAAVRLWTSATMFLFEAMMAQCVGDVLRDTALDFIALDRSGIGRRTLIPRLQTLGISMLQPP